MQKEELIDDNVDDGIEVVKLGRESIAEKKEMLDDLFEKVEGYVQTNIQLIKLKATDKVADVIGQIVTQIVTIVLFFFFLLMVNLGVAFWLGRILGQPYYGFFIVAGVYAIFVAILVIYRKTLIKAPINNSIINKILN
jgi:hypothetical protein